MKISYNWIQEYLNFDLPPVDELVERIGSQLGAVEEVVDLGKKYQGIIVSRIVSCRPVEDSDHLNLCTLDDGGAATDVERDESGRVQVVCGAPNVREGMLVAWLPPGSTVPSSFDKDPFVLGSRKLRGYMSNGMIASPQELAIGDSHEGILEIDSERQPGASLAEIYKLNDFIIDIENKMFTHRPDCFGILGVAREIAGILGHQFTEPDWYADFKADLSPRGNDLPLTIRNEAPELVPRFMAVALTNIEIKASTVWYQILLSRIGIRPINNIVDATNYYMYLTGQPLHAYDYDKVRALDANDGATLVARQVMQGEKLTLLNGKEIEPRQGAIVIATQSQAIGLGGVMGGANTEVDADTKNIILESATFDMYSIRKTSMVHGLFSEAVTRFNKGQSPYQNDRILIAAARFMCDTGGGEFASEILDEATSRLGDGQKTIDDVTIGLDFISERLGMAFDTDAVTELLTNVGFAVETLDNQELRVGVPFWRTDIEIREDIVEEVGRLYGFDKLPLELPKRKMAPATKNPMLELKDRLRNVLSGAGANEVLTYSFVHGKLLDSVGQDKELSYSLTNALSPELQYYRQSITPSLLEKVHRNIKAGYGRFALFELGRSHIIDAVTSPDDEVPAEHDRLGFVFAADAKTSRRYEGAPYYHARKHLDFLLEELGVAGKVQIKQYDPETYVGISKSKTSQYEASRTACLQLGDVCLGEIGEYKASVRKALKLPEYCAGFEIDTQVLLQQIIDTKSYRPLPKFPKTGQDICLRVPAATAYQDVFDLVRSMSLKTYGDHSAVSVDPVDIFQRDGDVDYKQITLRVSIASYQRTLTDTEVTQLLDKISVRAAETLQAERV